MGQITGVMTTGIQTVDVGGVTAGVKHIIHMNEGDNTMNAPVCVVAADLTSKAVVSTLQLNRGTWDGATFVLLQRICFISAGADQTMPQTVLKVLARGEALQIITTGDADTKAHIRIEGLTKAV